MATYMCGDVKFVMAPVGTSGFKTRWGFMVKLDGETIAQGLDLETPSSNPAIAVDALIGFLTYADSDAREVWGWTFDPDELRSRLEYDDENSVYDDTWVIRSVN